MKIRILDNCVRFRISKSELQQLTQGEAVSSSTQFPSNILHFTIRPSSNEFPTVDYKKDIISLLIPTGIIKDLSDSENVGITELTNFGSESLKIVFEKDFKCLTERSEDESDLFENPNPPH